MKLDREFYAKDATILAKDLLGKILVHEIDGFKISGKIVETEAYMGAIDKGAHTYNWKRTPRVEAMYGKPGISYVYFIYGMYYCFNVVAKEKEIPQAVLIRALEPLEGREEMSKNRFKKPFNNLTKREVINLTNGPSKLCNALKIDKTNNGEDLCENKLYILEGENEKFDVEASKRIGIDYAEEAKDYPWRFYVKGNPYVSKFRKNK
ncbi:DNA-3-methyladenine glycosylase [Clostridium brassicae]|uniref:Putative 3-methyladenine DNA glycosylase n=1 Tax=Clostridium brassicae TaxID=2999072 RepID=A0ABT4DC62_9CLOT|nr:DNA-3-methyladenine glycosylase [Clostridium brassicae]MCY6959253.1 DNA-3-methyladenine glycosylase [Clostridium brassicae]